MLRWCLICVCVLIAFANVMVGGAVARPVLNSRLEGGFVIKFIAFPADSLRNGQEPKQDTTINKKKIKEIAPAKRQPKPERIDDPLEGTRPGSINRPQFPGTDNRPQPGRGEIQPGNNRPQPQQPGGSRPSPQSPTGGGNPGGRRGG